MAKAAGATEIERADCLNGAGGDGQRGLIESLRGASEKGQGVRPCPLSFAGERGVEESPDYSQLAYLAQIRSIFLPFSVSANLARLPLKSSEVSFHRHSQ